MNFWSSRCQWRYVKCLLCIFLLIYGFLAIFRPSKDASANSSINVTLPPKAIPYEFYQWPPFIDVAQAVKNAWKGALVQPYNRWRFEFLLQPKTRSQTDAVSVFRVCVKSKVDHVDLRKAIRLTWGREDVIHGNSDWKFRLRTVFLLGKMDNWTRLVQKEADTYGDILQGDFSEHYRNNTMKMLMSFHYLIHQQTDFKYALFVDDDYFVSWSNMVEVLSELDQQDFSDLYVGFCWIAPPFRDPSVKHFVSLEEYPFDLYPPFIAAGAYVMSRESVTKFYLGSSFVKPYKMDDVYMGMIAKALNITPIHSERFDWMEPVKVDDRNFSYLAAAHGFSQPLKIVQLYMKLYM